MEKKKYPYNIEHVFDIAKLNYENTNIILQKNINALKSFEHKQVYWWGTGQLSIEYIDKVMQYMDMDIIPVDNQQSRKGYLISGITNPVIHSSELTNKHIDYLVIASSFINEIMKTLADYNITYSNLYCLTNDNELIMY